MKSQNILVTGGLGFIGSHLVDKLIDNGHKVYVIDNLSTGRKRNSNDLAKYYYLDINKFINSSIELIKIIKKNNIHSVFHLAANANVNASLNNPGEMLKVNFNASVAILEACKKTSVKKFIFASTSAVFGEPKYLPVDELHPIDPISPYGLSKLMFENYNKYFSKSSKISIINFRLPNVYGKRQRADLEGGVIAIFSERIKKNLKVNIYGNGNQKRDWVHVIDIVNAFEKSLYYNFKNEVILLGSLQSNTVNKLFALLSNQLHYKKKPTYLKVRDGDIKYMIMDNTKAKKLIKWTPSINFNDGIKLI